MASLMFVVLTLAMAGCSSATWCICKDGVSEKALQTTLDYACGAGADCTLIHQNMACFNPNTVRAHCSYAVNSFFQRKGQAPGTCDFTGTAAITASDPSINGCVYPSSASASTTPGTTTPTTSTPTVTTPSTTTPVGGSPLVTTPSTGVYGVGTGLGPSGAGINTDISQGGLALQETSLFSLLMMLLGSGYIFFLA